MPPSFANRRDFWFRSLTSIVMRGTNLRSPYSGHIAALRGTLIYWNYRGLEIGSTHERSVLSSVASGCGLTHTRDVKAFVSKVMVFDKPAVT
jgi:hypothetical protein